MLNNIDLPDMRSYILDKNQLILKDIYNDLYAARKDLCVSDMKKIQNEVRKLIEEKRFKEEDMFKKNRIKIIKC